MKLEALLSRQLHSKLKLLQQYTKPVTCEFPKINFKVPKLKQNYKNLIQIQTFATFSFNS